MPVVGYRRSSDPNVHVAFEDQAACMMATAAGAEIALDTRDVIDELRPGLMVADCVLPAALAAGKAAATPAASLVHFLYGLARQVMLQAGGSWTTDLHALAQTRRALGLALLESGLAAWERPDLVLVTAPDSLDVDADAAPHVVHAGPLGVDVAPARERSRVLLTFSTAVMAGQTALIERLGVAVAELTCSRRSRSAAPSDATPSTSPARLRSWPSATTIGCCPSARSSSLMAASERSYGRSPTESRC